MTGTLSFPVSHLISYKMLNSMNAFSAINTIECHILLLHIDYSFEIIVLRQSLLRYDSTSNDEKTLANCMGVLIVFLFHLGEANALVHKCILRINRPINGAQTCLYRSLFFFLSTKTDMFI